MGESKMFLIDKQGKCTTCSQAVVTAEIITCCSCSDHFHGQCSAVDKPNMVCNKTFLGLFLGASTKSNFKWFCDGCLTKFEVSKVATVEDKYGELVSQLAEVTKALTVVQTDISVIKNCSDKSNSHLPCHSDHGSRDVIQRTESDWSNVKRVDNMKASLVIKQAPGINKPDLKRLREIAVQNKIPVSNVRTSKKGDTFIQCPTTKDRDRLEPLLHADYGKEEVAALKEKLPHISIVDILKTDGVNVSKESILSDIRDQNPAISDLITAGEEFTVLFTKDGRNSDKCTAVARVSSKIRNFIKNSRNRVFIGISSCRVFDRFFVKRCNNCQEFGHYKDSCTNPVKCGHCGENHQSDTCTLKDSPDLSLLSCCNCKSLGLDHKGHSTFWNKCPAYNIAQKKLQSSIPYYDNLNA